MITKEQKEQIVADYGRTPGDTICSFCSFVIIDISSLSLFLNAGY